MEGRSFYSNSIEGFLAEEPHVNRDGSLNKSGDDVNDASVCVRPAFWLNLDSFNRKSAISAEHLSQKLRQKLPAKS